MHEIERFCRSFPWTIPVEWTGKVGTHRIDGERLAKIELSEGDGLPTHQHYKGMRVTILHTSTGRITSEFFSFNTALCDVPRVDSRDDQPGKDYHVIGYCGWRWYIHIPKTTQPFVRMVEGYIADFRQPGATRYAFVCDNGASGLPQVLIVRPTVEEIVAAAKAVYDEEYPGDDTLPEDEEWSFWKDETGNGNFVKLGYFTDHTGLQTFFEE